jgi:arsenate reductase
MEPGIVAHLTPRHDGAMTTTLYGLPNCDTVRRARAWLDERGVAYRFHDLGRHGVPAAELDRWLQAPGWEALVNRRGTTWRRLDAAVRDVLIDADAARPVLLAHPSLVRRPVVDWGTGRTTTTGFDAARWEAMLA